MFNKLFSYLVHISNFNTLTQYIENIVEGLESNYLKDQSMKNAAIDSIIEILQAHKDKTNG